MKKWIKFLGLVIFLSLFFSGSIIFGQATSPGAPQTAPPQTLPQPPPAQKCCIMGEYKGNHKDIPPKPAQNRKKVILKWSSIKINYVGQKFGGRSQTLTARPKILPVL